MGIYDGMLDALAAEGLMIYTTNRYSIYFHSMSNVLVFINGDFYWDIQFDYNSNFRCNES